MKTIRRFFFFLLLIAVLVFWTVFTIENPDNLTLGLVFWQSWSLPIAVWLLVAFVVGGVCGILLCASGYLHGKATQRQLKLELDRSRDELAHGDRPAEAGSSESSTSERVMKQPVNPETTP